METEKIQRTAIVILAAVVALGAFFIYKQNQTVSAISNRIKSFESGGGALAVDAKSSGELAKESLLEEKHDIAGVIRQIKSGSILVEAEVVDLDKINPEGYSSIEKSLKAFKSFEVLIGSETGISFMNGKIATKDDLRTGMHVAVVSKESVYQTARLNAESVIVSVFAGDER